MIKQAALALALATSSAFGQEEPPCGPKLEPMISTRVPDFDADGNATDRVITVSEIETETRSIVAVYDAPYSGYIGTFTMDGRIDFTNNSNVRRKIRFRQSILLDEGIMPIIPPAFAEVCWEPEIRRLITYYEVSLAAGESMQMPIFWEITTRPQAQLADVNADGVVDAADQGLLLAAFGTNNALYDLNQDGVVNSEDLGILLSQWSETSEDVIETSDARFNSDWDSADTILAATLEIDPIRGGNGQVRVPFLDWQWTA